MLQVRVMHYVNQIFAGIGGEDKAEAPLFSQAGAVGPGKRLQELLGDSAEIVVTVYCGDDYLPAHHDEVLEKIVQVARDYRIDFLVAGPAFASGRYGFACVEVCHTVSSSLDLYCVTSMYPENPGVEAYQQYHDRRVFLFPTTQAVSGMELALQKIARFIPRLTSGSPVGSAYEEGYIPRGFRDVEVLEQSGTERAIDMLLEKVAGGSFTTEIPLQGFEEVPIAPRVANLEDACVALVTTLGIVPAGNPDGFKQYRTTQWSKYSIGELDSMKDSQWEVHHIGVTAHTALSDANNGVPVDVCQQLQRTGVIGKLYPYYYSTTGAQALISVMKGIGREMARDMKTEGVDFAILTSA